MDYNRKIRFLVVANINGIKIPIKEFDYIVRSNNGNEFVSSIVSNRNTYPSRYSSLVGDVADLNNTKETSSYSFYTLRHGSGTGYRDVYLQLWGSMIPSSVNSLNETFSGDINRPAMLWTDLLVDGNFNVPYYYPLEHWNQRFNHHIEITGLSGPFDTPVILRKVRLVNLYARLSLYAKP